MKANLLPIGRMARINHVTVATLRLYDRMGLLKPAFIDPISGYRYYDIQQNARLDMIAYMKELGMSLAEIQDVLDKEDITLIEEILSEKNEQIYRQYRELKDRHASVARAIASIERYRKSPDTGTTSLEYIDQRYVWGIPCGENFYETGIAGYEKVLAELRMSLIDRNFSQIHSYTVGTSVKQADFLRLNFRFDRLGLHLRRRKPPKETAGRRHARQRNVRLHLCRRLRPGGSLREAAAGPLPGTALFDLWGLYLRSADGVQRLQRTQPKHVPAAPGPHLLPQGEAAPRDWRVRNAQGALKPRAYPSRRPRGGDGGFFFVKRLDSHPASGFMIYSSRDPGTTSRG